MRHGMGHVPVHTFRDVGAVRRSTWTTSRAFPV